MLNKTTGEMVRGRCRSTNLCAYCARLAAVENSEVLALDAMTTGGPRLYAVLTTRSTVRQPQPFYRRREAVQRALKRRWPDVQYAAQVEFTTGRAGTSRGARRPHWNLLLKGIPVEDLDAAHAVIRKVWCAWPDAEPQGLYVGLVEHAGGLMRYLALHFQKESQAPPHGWRGHRFLHSRGYFPEGVAHVREQARDQLRFRRVVHRLTKDLDRQGVDGLWAYEIDELAAAIHDRQKQDVWALRQVRELAGITSGTARRPPFAAAAEKRRRESTPGAGSAPLHPPPRTTSV